MTDPEFHYREIDPSPALAPFVRCIWRLRGVSDGAAEPIIPDGCAEIVINVGDPFIRYSANGSSQVQPARLVAGQIMRALTVQPSGRIDVWGVRFHPWCARAFLDLPAVELRDQVVALGDASASLDEMLSTVAEARDENAAEQRIVDMLTRYASRMSLPSASVPQLVMFATSGSDAASVSKLSRAAGVSTRRLQTLFRDHVGLSPKQLLRVTRFQRALRIARTEPQFSWSRVAMLAGFYDQAHLIHDANEIAGCTPAALVRRDAQITDAFLSDL
jgi:AraC-like DNA-binding protein